ncbi:MAG: PH domain-containing protein [bacterium]
MTIYYKIAKSFIFILLLKQGLKMYSGFFRKTLDLKKIAKVSKTRKGMGISFAFDTKFLWIGHPRKSKGVLISPKDQEIFLSELSRACPHLRLHNDELVIEC